VVPDKINKSNHITTENQMTGREGGNVADWEATEGYGDMKEDIWIWI